MVKCRQDAGKSEAFLQLWFPSKVMVEDLEDKEKWKK